MLNKPNDFDTVQGYGEFKPLEIGGHIMKIMNVEMVMSSTNKEMLKISLDTAQDDIQPGYFADKWRSDTRDEANRKWGCVMYQLVYDDMGATNRGFKSFITSVQESNDGFRVAWGASFEACFKGKRVGAIFREEEYMKNSGDYAMSVKPFAFRSVATVKAGVDKPAPKYLNGHGPANAAPGMGFRQPPDSSYGGATFSGRPAIPSAVAAEVRAQIPTGGQMLPGQEAYITGGATPPSPVEPPKVYAFEEIGYNETLPF